MRTMITLLFSVAAACSGGGPPAPPAQPSPGFLDLSGAWELTGTIVESDGVTTTGLEEAVAEFDFWAHSEADLYTFVLDGVPARPVGSQPASLFAVAPETGQAVVLAGGIYYLPEADVTVELGMALDSAQFATAFAEPGHFALLWDFDVYDGDAMVVVAPEGVPEWDIAEHAVRLGGGRLRLEAVRL